MANLHHTRLALVRFSQLLAKVVRHKANNGAVYTILAWISTILHCRKWYNFLLRTRLFSPLVQYLRVAE